MSSTIGHILKVSIFGQSHSEAIGCVIDGFPAGFAVDQEQLGAFMARRAPGGLPWSTPRKEADAVRFLGGLSQGVTCGAPLAAVIENTNTRSQDYDSLKTVPRPGHADYVAQVKWKGNQDCRGGGHFSGRLTAPLCVAGGIAKQYLETLGIVCGAHLIQVGSIHGTRWDSQQVSPDQLRYAQEAVFPAEPPYDQAMIDEIVQARSEKDSVGGVIECAMAGLPVGVGQPMFDGLENRIAQIAFGIPAVKGIEFGDGFEVAGRRGSANNDPYRMVDGQVSITSNTAGGILGGISNGQPLVFRVALKPTPSIFLPQESVDLSTGSNTQLAIHGRHDPCLSVRAVPVVEAACCLAVLDLLLEQRLDLV